MGSKRLFARALASLVTSIALVGGVGVVEVAQADTMTAAQHCARRGGTSQFTDRMTS